METLTPVAAGMLREARTSQRLLLREVAEVAGVSTTLVSNAELGKCRPNRRTGEALATALGLTEEQRAALLAECGTGRGARGPRTATEVVTLHCRGAEAPDPRRANRHSPRCRKTWSGPEYAARALRSRRPDGSFVCKSCHGYEVLFRNAAPSLVQRARDRAAIETDPAKRRALKAVTMPRTWTGLDNLVRILDTTPPRSGGGARKKVGPASPRKLAANWAAGNVKVSICEHCRMLVFTPQYQANTQGRLNRFHTPCKATAREGLSRSTRIPTPSVMGRPRDVQLLTETFGLAVRHVLGEEQIPALAREVGLSEGRLKARLREIRQEIPAAELVAPRFRPLIAALRLSDTPAQT